MGRDPLQQTEAKLKKEHRTYLDWEATQGWQPICEYLGRDVPDEKFPWSNTGGLSEERGTSHDEDGEEEYHEGLGGCCSRSGACWLCVVGVETCGLYVQPRPSLNHVQKGNCTFVSPFATRQRSALSFNGM